MDDLSLTLRSVLSSHGTSMTLTAASEHLAASPEWTGALSHHLEQTDSARPFLLLPFIRSLPNFFSIQLPRGRGEIVIHLTSPAEQQAVPVPPTGRRWRRCSRYRPEAGRTCKYGDRCTFLHDGSVPPAYQTSSSTGGYKVEEEELDDSVDEEALGVVATVPPAAVDARAADFEARPVVRGRVRAAAAAGASAGLSSGPSTISAATLPHPDVARSAETAQVIAASRAKSRCRHHAPWAGRHCRLGADCSFAHRAAPPDSWVKALATSLCADLPALQAVVAALVAAGGADIDRQLVIAHWLRAEAQSWLSCATCSSESLRTPRSVWVACGHRGPCLRCLRGRDRPVQPHCRDCEATPVAVVKLGDRAAAGYSKRLYTSGLSGSTYDDTARALAPLDAADRLRDAASVAGACAVPLVIAHLSLVEAGGDVDKACESLSTETLLGSINLGKLRSYAVSVEGDGAPFRTFASMSALVEAIPSGSGAPSRVPRAESPPSNSSASRVLEHFGSPDAHVSSSSLKQSPARRSLSPSFAQADARDDVVDASERCADTAAAATSASGKEERPAKKKAEREAKAAPQATEPADVKVSAVDEAAEPMSAVATKGPTPQSSLASSGKHTPPALPVVADSPSSSSLHSLGAALTLNRVLAAVPQGVTIGSVKWVAALVRAAGLREEHVAIFEAEEIDLAAFAILEDNDLREMGLGAKGPRLKVMRLVREVAVCTGVEELEGRSMMSSEVVSASIGERSRSVTSQVVAGCEYCGRGDHASPLCTETFVFHNGNVVRPMTPAEVAARNEAQGYVPRDTASLDATSYGESVSTQSACAFCSAPAIDLCSACMSVYYCSPMCQLMHWQDHKQVCRPCS